MSFFEYFIFYKTMIFLYYIIFLYFLEINAHWTTIIHNNTVIKNSTYTYNRTISSNIYSTISTYTDITTLIPTKTISSYTTIKGPCVKMIGFACNKGVYNIKSTITEIIDIYTQTVIQIPTYIIETKNTNTIIPTINISHENIVKTKKYIIKLYYNKKNNKWSIPYKYRYLLN